MKTTKIVEISKGLSVTYSDKTDGPISFEMSNPSQELTRTQAIDLLRVLGEYLQVTKTYSDER